MSPSGGALRARAARRLLLGLTLILLAVGAGQSLWRYGAWAMQRPQAREPAVRQVAGPAADWLPGVLAAVPEEEGILYIADEMRDPDWLAAYYLYPRPLHVQPAGGMMPERVRAWPWMLSGGRLLRLPAGEPVPLPAEEPPGFPPPAPGGRGWLALLLTAGAALGGGGLLLRALGARPAAADGDPAGRAGRAGLALLCGLGALGMAGFTAALFGLAGNPLMAWLLTLAGLAALPAAMAWVRQGAAPGKPAGGAPPVHRGRRAAGALLAVLALLLVAAPLARAVGEPMLHWDERFQWAYKGKILLHEGGIDGPSFQDPRRPHLHRRYPLLVPGLEAHLAALAGGFDERAVKGLFPLFFAGLLLAAHGAFRHRLAPLPALLFTSLMAALPPLHHATRIQGGPAHTGFADLPLAAFLAGATLLLLPLLDRRVTDGAPSSGASWRPLTAVALFAGLALATKPEGIAAAAAIVATAALACWRRRALPPRRHLLTAAALLLALALPRFWLGASVPTEGTVGYSGDEAYLERLTPSHLAAGVVQNLGPAAAAMAAAPFAWRWAGFGLLPAVGLAACLLTRRRGGHGLILLVALPLAADLLAFVVTGSTIRWHLAVALDRLWMQVAFPLLLMAAGQAARLADGEADPA